MTAEWISWAGAIGGLILSILAGVVSGIVAAFATKMLRPKVKISPIALVDIEGRVRVKLINWSWRRQVVDLSASLAIMSRTQNGLVTRSLDIQLPVSSYLGMAGRKTELVPWNLPFAYTFTSATFDGGVEALIRRVRETDGGRLVFTVRYSDALSGATVIQRVAFSAEDIMIGKFGKGFTVKSDAGSQIPDGQSPSV